MDEKTGALLAELDRLERAVCRGCSKRICGHEAVMSLALGYKSSPRCAPCLASDMGRKLDELREQVYEYVQFRDCFKTGWERAGAREGAAPGARPACLWPPAAPPMTDFNRTWDAGEMGCGDLVLELRLRLQAMKAGEVLRLTALDLGAPEDIPAWCRMTGHDLVAARPPDYFIRRKEN